MLAADRSGTAHAASARADTITDHQTASGSGNIAIEGDGTSGASGVVGTSDTNIGVYGSSSGNFGVYGISSTNAEVFGGSNSDTGVAGQSQSGIAVVGGSISGIGGKR